MNRNKFFFVFAILGNKYSQSGYQNKHECKCYLSCDDGNCFCCGSYVSKTINSKGVDLQQKGLIVY